MKFDVYHRTVEPAPSHDDDKALLSSAPTWEKLPLRLRHWPREKRVSVFHTRTQVILYNRRCQHQQLAWRRKGMAFRDFESTVFMVPKTDDHFLLCTDYHKLLNLFQRKTTFKMDDVQVIFNEGTMVCWLISKTHTSPWVCTLLIANIIVFDMQTQDSSCSGVRLASVFRKHRASAPKYWDH